MRPAASRALALGLALAFAAAYGASPTPAQDKKADPLSGKRFRSVEKHEGGLGPDGKVALRYYEIAFRDGGYTWDHSDVRERGAYEYDPKTGKITGGPSGGKLKFEGTYDPKTGVLVWEKKKYQEVRPEKP